MKRAFILLLIINILASCGSFLSKEECNLKSFNVNELTNQFIETSDTSKVHRALAIIDSVYHLCPNEKPYFTIKKIGFLTVLGDFERAYLFVDTTDAELFDIEYQKNMYYHSLKARHYNKIGQLADRNKEAKISANIVEEYLNKNPNSLDAIMDLAASMAIYVDEETYYATLNARIGQATFEDENMKEAIQNSLPDTYKIFNP